MLFPMYLYIANPIYRGLYTFIIFLFNIRIKVIYLPTYSFMDASQCLLVGLVLARSNLVEILHFISCTVDAF